MVWRGRRPAMVFKSRRRSEANSVRIPEVEAQSNSSSSLPRPLGPVCLKLVTQDASGLHFWRSIYGWKANFIRKPIQVVSHQKTFGINGNHQNKWTSRICQGAATPSFGPLGHVYIKWYQRPCCPLGILLFSLLDCYCFCITYRPQKAKKYTLPRIPCPIASLYSAISFLFHVVEFVS